MAAVFTDVPQDSGLNADDISRDQTVVAAYKADPLVHSKITASAGMSMTESAAFLNTFAGVMPIPTLILHGTDDKLIAQSASEAFAKRVKNVDYKKYVGLYHEIHNDPEKMDVLNDILKWIIDNG